MVVRSAADRQRLDPDLLLRAYAAGIFPMGETRDAPDVFWVEPKRRGVLPLAGFHLAHSLAKTIRAERFEVTANRDFAAVMHGCAERTDGREDSWINGTIVEAYSALHDRGSAHSIECWHDGELAGGLYGVSIGGAFFGESMFTRQRDASKVALAHLVARLKVGGFTLLDTQFLTAHLASFGAVELPRTAYRAQLAAAVAGSGDFSALERRGLSALAPRDATTVSGPVSGKAIAQLLTQTS
ncbi:MAG: leucyl/phenylalanyl-tRNA--protein transferase [Polymorphobacter sp.]